MRIGIDLGGTKIEGIVLDGQGSERARLRVPTPSHSYDETVAAVAEVVRQLEVRAGVRCRVGVGHPGAISPATGLIKNANSTRLNGHPLDRDLRRALGRDEVRLANDANCFAVSEAADGAGAGCKIVFGVIELVMGLMNTGSVAHFAHLGGMVGGFLMIRFWRGQPPFRSRRRH